MKSNQELEEMIQALEETVVRLQRTIAVLESDLDDVNVRSNRLIEKVVTKGQFNTSMAIQKRYGLDHPRGRL